MKNINRCKPIRLQRKRTKGFKLISPNGLPVVYVGRPTKWGNPFKVGSTCKNLMGTEFKIETVQEAVNAYKNLYLTRIDPGFIFGHALLIQADLSELKGKDLACWCKEGSVCHGDVLLELANK